MVDRLIKVIKPSAYQGDKRKVSSSTGAIRLFLYFVISGFRIILELKIGLSKPGFFYLRVLMGLLFYDAEN